jgi:hypothetical protein
MLRQTFGLTVHEMARVGGATFAYLFRRIKQRQLVHIIRESAPDCEERILKAVRESGYVMMNCKAYAWAFFKSRSGGPKPDPKAYGIHRDDVAFLSRLNLAHIPAKYPALSLDEYKQKIFTAVRGKVTSDYMGKFVSAKMQFLWRSYGAKRGELENDMLIAGIRAIYRRWPYFESDSHMAGFAQAAIKNTGKSLITYFTAPSRQRLSTQADGHNEQVVIPLEAVEETIAAPESEGKETLEVLTQIKDTLRPDVQRFLNCCAGQYDEGFSEFLDQNNVDALESMPYQRYVTKARQHFNFSEEQVTHLFQTLRTRLE